MPSKENKPLPPTRWGLFLEGLAPWRNTILAVLVVGGLFVASRFDSLRPTVALVVAVGAPPAALLLAFLPLRDAPVALKVVGLALLLAAGATFVTEDWETFRPPEAYGSARLSGGEEGETAEIDLPAGVKAFELEVHGKLLSSEGEATGKYALLLTRGDEVTRVAGEMSRTAQARRVGRRLRVRSMVSHDFTRVPVQLDGQGPLEVEVAHIEGLRDRLQVLVLPAPLVGGPLWAVLGVLAALALVVEAWAGRHRLEARWTAAIAASGVFVHHVVYNYDASDPVTTIFGGLLFAAVTGGLGGWILGVVVAHLAQERRTRKGTVGVGRG